MAKVNSMVNKVKNVVMQYSEWEGKVREATNNDPWGTASTQQMEIANGKLDPQFSYVSLEPPSSTWRQTYKGLQLLEFLIKNGSEQVIDNARNHIYEIKACENYHYVDDKKKDQGINIRHRAKEIVDLLGNDNKIREERQKAKENRNKYKGVSSYEMKSGGGFGSDSYSSDQRGFGSDSYSSDNYRSGGFRDSVSRYDGQSNRYDTEVKSSAKIEKVAPIEKKPDPKPAVKDLLDMGADNDWSDFNAAPVTTKQNDFANFQSPTTKQSDFEFTEFVSASQPAPVSNSGFANFGAVSPAKVSPSGNVTFNTNAQAFGNFADSNLGMKNNQTLGNNSQGFANFSQPPTATNFANFSAAPQPATNQGFANFNAAPTANNQAFANFTTQNNQQFGAFPSPVKSSGFGDFSNSQNAPKTEFGNFAQASAPAPTANDPIAKLVSLDAFSLVSNGKKDTGTGPSLNSLGTPNKPGF
ncbi:Epsin-3, clathrin recruitment and traffic between the Golgi and endosome [Boothiomyces macroporosus]|uniref:Epsin-3, clathrin recruitment and traffic between the Golgi and endosome n=1 Tax=Boothiomyces macroporosus TaxID=261099 RepID=A0AAD5UIE3_9FUNG|nr:Epsin-3, clathrin recruitment and traffic between the Golgi and endosome [Boothiomyces macroporosus]